MLRGIILDLDGVVIDSHPAHKRAWMAFFASLGKQVSDEELEFVVEGQKREDILRHFLGDLSDEQLREYGAQKETLFQTVGSEIQAVSGLPEFIAQLASIPISLAIASSARRKRVESVLRQLNLSHQFQAVIAGGDVIKGKPDPAIFRLAAERIQISPSEALVCEDAVSGVEAAKAAGMKCLAIAANGRGPLLARAGADKVVADFTQVTLEELQRLFA